MTPSCTAATQQLANMPPVPNDMFALLVASVLGFIETQKAANACTLVTVFDHVADQRLPGLVKHLALNPASLRKDFRVGHCTLTLPDIPYSTAQALEEHHILTPSGLNQLCFSTGFCNMAFSGKFACFKPKYMGVLPAPNDNLHDTAVVFVVRIDDRSAAVIGDLLLFCANCVNVLGVNPSVFKTIVSTHWATLTQQQKHAGKHKTPTFKIGELQWILTPEQEMEIVSKGIAETPVPSIFRDAAELHRLSSHIRTNPNGGPAYVVATSPHSSTVAMMTQILQNQLDAAIKSFEHLIGLSYHTILSDPKYIQMALFTGKPSITIQDTQIIASNAKYVFEKTSMLATGGNQALLNGIYESILLAIRNLECILPVPLSIPMPPPDLGLEMSLESLGLSSPESSFSRLVRQIQSPTGNILPESSLEKMLRTISPVNTNDQVQAIRCGRFTNMIMNIGKRMRAT